MPWTTSTLYIVDLDSDGMPTRDPIEIAGGAEVSLFQPEWSPDGSALFYVSDKAVGGIFTDMTSIQMQPDASHRCRPNSHGRHGTLACPCTPLLEQTGWSLPM